MDATVQQYSGILPIGHTARLGAGQAGERDLARRCPPRARMRPPPAKPAPVDTRIERRPAIMANRGSHLESATVILSHRYFAAREPDKKRADSMIRC